MKYFIITAARCGSHYCGESIALRLQILPLGECLKPTYKNDRYIFENNQVQTRYIPVSGPSNIHRRSGKQHEGGSSNVEIQNRLNNLLATDNDWQAQAHIDNLKLPWPQRHLDKDAIKNIVEKTNAILLYRENFTNAIISWVIAKENDNFVLREQQEIQRVYYDKNKHLDIIKCIINDYKILQEIKDKYNWFKVYKYEDFTGDPNLDFSDYYTLQKMKISWNLPIKNNTEKEKRSLIVNIEELINDIKYL